MDEIPQVGVKNRPFKNPEMDSPLSDATSRKRGDTKDCKSTLDQTRLYWLQVWHVAMRDFLCGVPLCDPVLSVVELSAATRISAPALGQAALPAPPDTIQKPSSPQTQSLQLRQPTREEPTRYVRAEIPDA